ncbi:MAG: ABC transporter permease subunit [Clostridia bacterium]|nr:ABC transporter permease subunit [Clostridia bacterium]
MKGAVKKTVLDIAFPVVSLLIFLLIWQIGASIYNIELILPTPIATFTRFFALFAEAEFWGAFFGTVLRSLIAFGISFCVALLCSIIGVLVPAVHKMVYPFVVILRALPTMSVILLSLIWLSSTKSPILITFLVLFPMMYVGFYDALTGVDPQLIEMARVYGVSKRDRIVYLYFPAVLRSLFTDALSALTFGVKLTVAAEALAQTGESLGLLMQISKYHLDTAGLLAYTVAAVLLSYLFELAVRLIKKTVRFPL